jgi:hypothetical protein
VTKFQHGLDKLTKTAGWLDPADAAFVLEAQSLLKHVEGFYREIYWSIALLQQCRTALDENIKKMESGVALSAIQPTAEMFGAWMRMAGNTAALSLFHIDQLLDEAQGSLGKVAALKDANGRKKLKTGQRFQAASKMLSDLFPTLSELRHAVGHEAELLMAKDQHRSGPSFISASFLGDDYAFTKDGEIVSITLNPEVAERLVAVVLQPFKYVDAFLEERTPK